ncbi:MAG: glycosyltransferase [Acidobacteriaceae bacterium]|nr:glycosyltransferase [Acidobacteriaceae bacterium]
MAERPKVSVAMITYNHERLFGQAIESVLSQERNFDLEIVIGEDCSTDRTREVVLQYHREHPEIIRPLLPDKNLGHERNMANVLAACRGEYIALLEGDDYWTDTRKLQKQIGYLDTHPDCAICFHQVLYKWEDGSQPSRVAPLNQKPVSTLRDIVAGNIIPTCSAVFRKTKYTEVPEWSRQVGFSDWPIHVMNARAGNIAFLPECMAVYRQHSGGVWSTQTWRSVNERWIKAYQFVNADFDYKFDRIITRAIFMRRYGYAIGCFERYDSETRSAVTEALLSPPLLGSWWEKTLLLTKLYLPWAIRMMGRARRVLQGSGA